ncbi:MAG: corrinoid protein [Anaerolineales bacterium]|nr:corrinoid protein [Anaerolineales bacterium]
MTDSIVKAFEGILKGDQEQVAEHVQLALDEGTAPREILNEGLISAMDRVGVLFETNEYYVPEMLIAARAMKAGLEILRPELMNAEVEAVGKVLIGTVQGDLHDIGKKLVAIMLEGAGFQVVDLGVDTPPEKIVEALKAETADIVALSALLTTTMMNMKGAITSVEEAGLRDQVKIIVGGAPVTEEFAREIGADGFAADASAAVKLAKTLMS